MRLPKPATAAFRRFAEITYILRYSVTSRTAFAAASPDSKVMSAVFEVL
jgi:hypothetical protein